MGTYLSTVDRMRRPLVAIAVLGALVVGTSLGQAHEASANHAAKPVLKAAYVSNSPIGQDPFLQLIAEGLQQGGKACGVQTKVIQSPDDTALPNNFRTAIQQGYGLVIGNSFDSVQPITELSKQFPKEKWAIVDNPTIPGNKNVRGIEFKEFQGMFLVGAVFGLLATGKYHGFPKSKVIGGVGAVNSPLIRRWSDGLIQGIQYVNPREHIKIAWTNSFSDPATAKELALSQYQAGAKYIAAFAASGNTGVFEAAKQDNFYTSGVDTDQRPIDPKHILISMVKRSDIAVKQAVCDYAHSKFTGVTKTYGLKEKGNGPEFLVLPKKDLKTPSRVPAAVQKIIRSLATKIIKNQIHVHA